MSGRAGLVDSLLQEAARRAAERTGPWARAKQALDRVASVTVGVAGFSAGVGTHPHAEDARDGTSTVSPGALAAALASLAAEIRRDAPNGGLLVTVDEMQVASHGDLALLAATLHRLTVDHPAAAVMFAGTGLPHVPEVLRAAGVTHPDRLFLVEHLSVTLAERDAVYAIAEPARRVGVLWQPEAASWIVRVSNGHPAHLQQFAHTVWTTAAGPHTITVDDVAHALPRVERDLDRRTLGPRWDRMSDRQMEYLAALSLHGGRTSTRVLAATLGRTASELSWIRQDLIEEGDVYSPQRGRLALAVPVLAPFVLAHYEEARQDAETELLPLAVLRERAAAAIAPRPLPEVTGRGSADG